MKMSNQKSIRQNSNNMTTKSIIKSNQSHYYGYVCINVLNINIYIFLFVLKYKYKFIIYIYTYFFFLDKYLVEIIHECAHI